MQDLTLWLMACLAWTGCGSCDGDDRPDGSAPPLPAVDRPDVLAPRTVATPQAFDLFNVSDGAVFLWSPPFLEGGGVRLLRLDAMGTPTTSEIAVFAPATFDEHPPDAFVVRGAAGGGRLAVAWVQREVFQRKTYATFGPDTGEGFAAIEEVADLGTATSPLGAVAAAATTDSPRMTVKDNRAAVSDADRQ